jgi:hypothetical protein
MLISSAMLSFLGPLLLAVPAQNAAPTAQPAAQPASRSGATATQGSLFGAPLVVHGRRITDDEIKRFLCHSVGGRDGDMFKFSVMVDQELQKRREQGLETAEQQAKYAVPDADLQRRLDREREDFLLRYPTLDFPTEVGRAELSLELFRERLRATMRFDRVFRPDDPLEWPEITKAIIIEQMGEQWIEDERQSYSVRLKRLFEAPPQHDLLDKAGMGAFVEHVHTLQIENLQALVEFMETDPRVDEALAHLRSAGMGDIPADDPIAVDATRGTILGELNKWTIQHIDHDAIAMALPPLGKDAPGDEAARARAALERADKVLSVVEGVPIFVAQVWDRIAPHVPSDAIEDAKRFLAMQALLERELAQKTVKVKKGDADVEVPALMAQPEFREWWPTTARAGKPSYMEFLQANEMVSSQLLGFPSLFAFATYMRLEESFRRTIADELANVDLLTATLPRINQIAGAARLNVNVILLSAYDFVHVGWKPNGWAEAKQRALDLKKSLDEGAEWQATLELHSEFWDPPMPDTGNKPMQNFYFKGTFANQPLTRNQLVNYLHDSEYRIFLYGPCISDHIFFDQKMGSIEGPFRGAKGYYIARTTGKTAPMSQLNMATPVHRDIVVHYYLKNAMNARALALLNEGIDSGAVTGLTKRGGIKEL